MFLIKAGLVILVAAILQVEAQLTADNKDSILDAHNGFRRTVSPAASNMLELVSHCLHACQVRHYIWLQTYSTCTCSTGCTS